MWQPVRRPPPTLRKRSEFLHVQGQGRRFRGETMTLITCHNPQSTARVGYTVSRKVGGAVVRNRLRRQLRELMRLHPTALRSGFDHVFIASPLTAGRSYAALQREALGLLSRSSSCS